MTEDQLKNLQTNIGIIIDNQTILSNKLNAIRTELDSAYSDIRVVINNQHLIGEDLDNITEKINRISKGLSGNK